MSNNEEERRRVNEYRLFEDNELRIEIADEEVVIELLEGQAEIFGTSISLHKRYTLPPGFRAAVFTYKGALVEVVGKTESAYIAQQTPMIFYLNLHHALDTLCQKAEGALALDSNATVRGPRVMITGPVDVGKSTLCRILCNYAVRQNRTPIYVDLDVGQRTISIPGSIGALYIEKPADIVDGFDSRAAYVYNFGHLTPSDNMPLYTIIMHELAQAVDKKCKLTPAANIGGVIINTCGWIKGDGYQTIVKAAEEFSVDVVVVLDHERLYSELQRDLVNSIKVLHYPKSGGVEARNSKLRQTMRLNAIHKYFYGTKSMPLFPHSFEISFDKPPEQQELPILKVGAERLPDSCLPYGMKVEDHRTMVISVPISESLVNHVVALMPPDATVADQSLLRRNCIGYLVIVGVDMEKKSITVLSPQPHPLPSRIALYTDVTFVDDQSSR